MTAPENSPAAAGASDADEEQLVRVQKHEFVAASASFREVTDELAREEPLEIRIGGVPIAVVMRTPGHDEELVRGFLLTEHIVAAPSAIASIRHCSEADEDNVMQVVLGPGHEVDLASLRRNLYASSSCGLCGKASIDQVMRDVAPLPAGPPVPATLLASLPDRLRTEQAVFARTGGLHAAGLFRDDGELVVVREDVGRHNAVDKAIGFAATSTWPPPPVLVVSGRISFEIAQKAALAGVRIIVAVSAPTSLAVELGERAGLTLVGFVRDGRCSIYSAPERVAADRP